MKSPISPLTIKTLLADSNKQSNGAPITIKSKNTGKDYTFKLARKFFNDKGYLHIKVETQYMDFKYLGHYKNGTIVRKGSEVTTPSATAIGWLLRNIEKSNIEVVDRGVEIMHIGKCIKCGKPLTDANSIEIGLGPICRG
jgi:hypothetical protein